MSDDTPSVPTDEAKMNAAEEEPYITQPFRKPPTVAHMLANHLDWLQYDIEHINETLVTFMTRTAIAHSRIQEQGRYTWIALVCVALLLLINAVLDGGIIYLLGILIGHIH